MSRVPVRTVAELAWLGASDALALITPAEVAALFRVDPKTVGRWETAGRLPCIRTLGGHRRFRVADVLAALGVDS